MTTTMALDLNDYLPSVADFPRPGVVFRDIGPLLASPAAFAQAIDGLAAAAASREFTRIAGIESRGLIFAAALALQLGKPLVPVRKPGKLPRTRLREEYALEYGTDALEMHEDAIAKGSRVVIVDDVLATGGTARAVASLVRRAGGHPGGALFLNELGYLGGAAKLGDLPVRALLRY